MKDAPVDAVSVARTEIDWYRSTPWWRLLSKSIAISIRSTHLIICMIGIWAVMAGNWLANVFFGTDSVLTSLTIPSSADGPSQSSAWILSRLSASTTDAFEAMQFLVYPFNALFEVDSLVNLAAGLFRLLWTIVVWALIGGMILRRSVVELGTESTSGWVGAYRVVRQRYLAFIWALGTPLLGIFCFLAVPLLLGFISRLGGFGSLLAGLLSIPLILVAIPVGWLAVVGVLGLPLSWAAIATEKNADAFDGFSRSAAYLLQKPFTVFLAALVAIQVFVVASLLVNFAIDTGVSAYVSAFEVGAGEQVSETYSATQVATREATPSEATPSEATPSEATPSEATPSEATPSEATSSEATPSKATSSELQDAGNRPSGSGLFDLAMGFVLLFKTALPISFFWTATAAIYLVVRKEVDSTDYDDVELNENLPSTEGENAAAENSESLNPSKVESPAADSAAGSAAAQQSSPPADKPEDSTDSGPTNSTS